MPPHQFQEKHNEYLQPCNDIGNCRIGCGGMVAAVTRRSFNRKQRAYHFDRLAGVCYLCNGKIAATEAWEIEHVIPWEFTHDDSDDNLRLAHVKCHKRKTATDRRDIAKSNRVRAKHDGTFPKPQGNARLQSRPFPKARKAQ